jgi:hypothetical protein
MCRHWSAELAMRGQFVGNTHDRHRQQRVEFVLRG